MLGLFLDTLGANPDLTSLMPNLLVFGILYGILGLFVLAFYIYLSLAFMAIAKKTKYKSPGIAWIPGVGPLIIANSTAKMHWWPWLILIGIIIPFVNFIALLVFAIFSIIWMWKTFEAVGKPGWWILIPSITGISQAVCISIISASIIRGGDVFAAVTTILYVSLAFTIVNVVVSAIIFGVVAWSKK